MPAMNAPVKAARVETAAEKLAWRAMKDEMRRQRISRPDQKFLVPGYIVKLEGDPNDPSKPVIIDNSKFNPEKPTRAVLNATVKTTLAGCELIEFRKQIGYSFFDGYGRKGDRSPMQMRGGLWHIHYSVTGNEVPKELVDGKVGFDTDDYCGPTHPLLLRLVFKGVIEEGQDYYGTRGNIKLYLDGFEPDPDAVGGGELPDDDDSWLGETGPKGEGGLASAPDEMDDLPL